MKKKDKMGLYLLVWAFVFLFNPNLNIIDILPDFIGYALICAALARICDINDDIAIARKSFGKALFADVLKSISIFVVFGTQNPEEQNTLLLLVSFAFAVIELVILIPAYKALFGGLIGLGYKYENSSVLTSKRGRRKNHTELVRAFTYFFLIIKSAAYSLPELAVLSTQNYDDMSRTQFIYDFIGLLRGFAIIVSLIVGIVWLCRMEKYFARVRKDEAFMSALAKDYESNILPKDSLFVRKAAKRLFLVLLIASLLCFDFRIQGINLIMDSLVALTLIIGFFSVRKYIGTVKGSLIPFVVYAVASFAATVSEYSFFSKYYYGAILRNDAAYASYKTMLVFSVLDALAFLYAVWGMRRMLYQLIKEHTGFYVPSASINVDDKIKKVHVELNEKLTVFCVAAVFAAASDLFYDFYASKLEFVGFVNTILIGIFVVTLIMACNAIGEEVESKYMLD